MPPRAGEPEGSKDEETADLALIESKKSILRPLHLLSVSEASPAQQKSVRFQDSVRFLEVRPREFFGVDEVRSLWYSDDEYAKIKKVVKTMVKKSEKGETTEELKGVTMRGLEGRTKFGARRRKNNKAAALKAVWETQIEFWRKSMPNQPMAIAAAYRPHSTSK